MRALEKKGKASDQVLTELGEMTDGDIDWRTGQILTGLYDPGEEAYQLTREAYSRFLTQNALYINMYPSASRMEQEVVRSIADLLRGNDAVAGSMTSGGTESILLAVKASRDHARANRPEITDPEIVLPITAHPAFHKAAHYLGLRVVVTPVGGEDFRADAEAFRAALGPNTILGVGSAPNFSHGTIDPIEEMAAAAHERGILFHVDACVGGVYLSFMRRLGMLSKPFDFSIEGVTTISADMHKYGYAPKNASVLLYRNRELRSHAFFVCSGTTEYAVINPTVLSSKSAGPIAASWAVLRHLGEEGYERIVKESWEATRAMLDGIGKIDGVEVLAQPDMCMFTLGSTEINIFELDDEMQARGWALLPQFGCGGGPANLHVSVSKSNVPLVDRFLTDLRESVEQLETQGTSIDREALAREVDAVKDAPLEQVFARLAQLAGLSADGLPERLGLMNTILDLLPAARRDEILTAYINAL